MATPRSIVLRLLREPAPERDAERDGAPDARPAGSPGDVTGGLHARVRTYAAGSVPRGRRIRPPTDDAAPDSGEPATDDAAALVPVHRIQELLEIYTRFMGPASKRVLDTQLRALGATPQSLRVDRLPMLVKRLAKLIDTPEKKRRFLAAMTKVPGAIG